MRRDPAFEELRAALAEAPSDVSDPVRERQLVRAVQVAYEEATTLAEALDIVDPGGVNLIDLRHVATGRVYRAYEYGAGENSYGAIFEGEGLEMVSAITDDYLNECNTRDRAVEVEGVAFSADEARATLRYANETDEATLRADGVDGRAVASILAARPIASMEALAELYWVGPATLRALKDAANAACESVTAAPLGTGIDLAAINASCRPIGGWCTVSTLERLRLDACGGDMDAVVEAALAATGDRFSGHARYALNRNSLRQRPQFEHGLLDAMDAEVGADRERIEARTFESEVACHNCTEFSAGAVVFYPDAGVAYVVDGTFGFDS